MTLRFLLAPVLICFSLTPALAQGLAQSAYEQSLLQAIANIQHLNHDQALADTREFLRQYPTSKLGQLLYADLLLAKADILPTIGYGLQSKSELNDLTFEIRQRLSNQQALAYAGYLPENLISMSENQPYVLVMDQSLSRVYVYRNEQGMPVLETDYFLSIGLKGFGKQKEGDKKTPIGVYHVTSYIDGEKLPDLYGEGAFPVNYPNVWDKRNKRTGSGIWIHGTPSHTYNRAPWSSDGCMVVSNLDFTSLARYIDPQHQTPVIVVEQVNWITPEQWRDNQRDMLQLLTRWIEDWESNDLDNYSSHYSKNEFISAYGRDFANWKGHKKWVNGKKTYVNVEFSNLNIFLYPGEQDLMLMQYDQIYRSNNFNNETAKQLYWRKQQNRWQIVYEGTRPLNKANARLASN